MLRREVMTAPPGEAAGADVRWERVGEHAGPAVLGARLATPGTALLLSGLLTMLVLRIPPRVALRAYKDTPARLRGAILTIIAVLARVRDEPVR